MCYVFTVLLEISMYFQIIYFVFQKDKLFISKDRVNPCYVKLHSVVCDVVNVFTVFS